MRELTHEEVEAVVGGFPIIIGAEAPTSAFPIIIGVEASAFPIIIG